MLPIKKNKKDFRKLLNSNLYSISKQWFGKKFKFVVNGKKFYSPVKRFQNAEGLLIEHIAPSRIFASCTYCVFLYTLSLYIATDFFKLWIAQYGINCPICRRLHNFSQSTLIFTFCSTLPELHHVARLPGGLWRFHQPTIVQSESNSFWMML